MNWKMLFDKETLDEGQEIYGYNSVVSYKDIDGEISADIHDIFDVETYHANIKHDNQSILIKTCTCNIGNEHNNCRWTKGS